MAIYRLLQNVPMEPEAVKRLTTAYESALVTLRLNDRDDPITRLVAKKIIEVAQTGVKDPAQISEQAIRELRSEDQTVEEYMAQRRI